MTDESNADNTDIAKDARSYVLAPVSAVAQYYEKTPLKVASKVLSNAHIPGISTIAKLGIAGAYSTASAVDQDIKPAIEAAGVLGCAAVSGTVAFVTSTAVAGVGVAESTTGFGAVVGVPTVLYAPVAGTAAYVATDVACSKGVDMLKDSALVASLQGVLDEHNKYVSVVDRVPSEALAEPAKEMTDNQRATLAKLDPSLLNGTTPAAMSNNELTALAGNNLELLKMLQDKNKSFNMQVVGNETKAPVGVRISDEVAQQIVSSDNKKTQI